MSRSPLARPIRKLVVLFLLWSLLLASSAQSEDVERIIRAADRSPTPETVAAQRAALARFVAAAQSRESGARIAAATPGGETQSLGATYLDLASPNGITGFGASVTGVGDINRDGFADFIATTSGVGGSGWGVYLYFGGDPPSATAAWQSESFGYPPTVAAAGDVNGDGYDDVIFSYGSKTSSITGLVEVRHGSASGLSSSPDFLVVSGGSFGACAATAGDVNGDGIDDIVVGAPFDANGRAYVYYGSITGLNAANRLILDSPAAGLGFGTAVAGAGDVNGDNTPDVIVGAPNGHQPTGDGAVYLYSDLIHANTSPQQVFPPPSASFVDFGAAVGPAGDVNGDGYADVVIGDPAYFILDSINRGRMQVFLGAPAGIGASYLTSLGTQSRFFGADVFTAGDLNSDGYADVLMVGGNGVVTVSPRLFAGGPLGSSVISFPASLPSTNLLSMRPAGDVNGDGFGDLVVGLPGISGSGRVRLYFGQSDGISTTPVAQCFGGQDIALAGWSTAMGDVNGDGYDDLVVGMPQWDAPGPNGFNAGAIALYFGGPGGIASTPSYFFEGAVSDGYLGSSVSAGGDENGDGIGDMIAGAPGAGQVLLWYGRPDWNGASWTWEIQGSASWQYGASVAFAGDTNGDGYADFLIGAPDYDWVSPPITNAGRVRLVNGGALLSLNVWHPAVAQTDGHEGSCVASAGDVNRDGYSDIVIGTGSFDYIGSDTGHVLLFLGSPIGISDLPYFEWTGDGPGQFFGSSVAGIGDYDGDGFGDLAIGAFNYPGGGRVYVESGSTYSPIAWFDSPQAGCAFGWSVAPAGDVNGDGKSDVVAGAVFFDGVSGFDDGRVSVFLGGSPPLAAPYVVIDGSAYAENVGHAVAGGGDLNGDGFADIAVGAPRAFGGVVMGGVVRVYAGNSLRPAIGAPVQGRARRAQMRRPDYTYVPLTTYDRSPGIDRVSLAMDTASPAGREPVAMAWQIFDMNGSTQGAGRTSWEFMRSPAAPLAGAFPAIGTPSALTADAVYGWRTRVCSHSPYFRYGPWFAPQGNGRLQWDFRTAPANVGVAQTVHVSTELEMSAPWPNPARAKVNVELILPRAASTRLVVRDLQGRAVRTIEDHMLSAGRYSIYWDCRGDDGGAAPAGMYFLDLVSGSERVARRVAIVR